MIFLPVPAYRRNVTRVRFFRSERRMREQAVPVVRVVQAARAGAVRAAPGNHQRKRMFVNGFWLSAWFAVGAGGRGLGRGPGGWGHGGVPRR